MDNEKKKDEYKKYLEKQISIIQEEIDYLRGRLKALDSSEYDSTDSE
jgi:hypothetical protein